MPALRVEMHFGGNACFLQGCIIGQGLLDAIDMIVFRLQQKGRRRIVSYMDVAAQAEVRLVAGGMILILVDPEMPRVDEMAMVKSGRLLTASAASTG